MDKNVLRKKIIYAMAIISLLSLAFINVEYIEYIFFREKNSISRYDYVKYYSLDTFTGMRIAQSVLYYLQLVFSLVSMILMIKKDNKITSLISSILILLSAASMSILSIIFFCYNYQYGYDYFQRYAIVLGIEILLFVKLCLTNRGQKTMYISKDKLSNVANDNIDDLICCKNLLDQGVITQHEYEKLKNDLLK